LESGPILVWVHILLFVYWLGADLGVLIAAIWVRNPARGLAERAVLLQIATAIDLTPRLAFALTMPVGIMLARRYGLPVSDQGLAAIWIIALIWCAAILAMARLPGSRVASRLAHVQFGVLIIGGLGFVAAGAHLLVGSAIPPWLAWKLILFGLIFFLAIGIDLAFRPIVPAFGRLASEGSSPAVEAAIRRPLDRSIAVVLSLYATLLAVSFLGAVKPAFAP
jgi:hypothetical protein